MAGQISQGVGYGNGGGSTEDLNPDRVKELEEHIYRKLIETGINKLVLGAHKLDRRMFHYFFKVAPLYTQGKVEFMEKLLGVVKREYPGLYDLHEEMEAYICLLKELGKSSGSISVKAH